MIKLCWQKNFKEEIILKIGIIGYGNLGRGVELAIKQNNDMELVAVFTRRSPESVKTVGNVPVYHIDNVEKYKDDIDVMILCGGSATDLPIQGPKYLSMFNCVDSFDNHGKIPEYFDKMDAIAKESGKIGVISVGWDPGLFSIQRALFESILPEGETYTFWGKGVSQGHSDAIRRVEGVKTGKQYTIPVEEAINKARSGNNPILTTRDKHLRECFIVAEEGADLNRIEETIKTMPNYFADYNTIVHFVSEEEFIRDHSGIPHGGFVIRGGGTGERLDMRHVLEFSIKLDSNPEFTSSVIVAYARAAYKMSKDGQSGAKTALDIPLSYLSPKTPAQLRKDLV